MDDIHDIKHPTWVCGFDYTGYFVVFKLMDEMNPHATRFYVFLNIFSFLYSAFIFLKQVELILEAFQKFLKRFKCTL